MKAHKVVLMAAALLLVAGCSDEVSTGPEAPLQRPVPAEPGDEGYSFIADGAAWTIQVTPVGDGTEARTRILKNGQEYATFDGEADATTADVISAQVFESGKLVVANEVVLEAPPSTMNQMALDIPCQAELEAFLGATLILSWRLYQARYGTGSLRSVAFAAGAVYLAGRALYQCVERHERQLQGS